MTRVCICILALLVPVLATAAIDFDAPDYYPVGNIPQSLSTGDYDGDGHPDLAVVNWQDGDITVLLGDGQGGFVTASVVPTGPSSVALDSGDFNEDGQVDLLVVEADSQTVRLLWGDGQGGFVSGPGGCCGATAREAS